MPSPRILIVEDNVTLRDHVAQILTMENYDVFTAPDGAVGLRLVRDTAPDLVLCDVMMPEMTGHQMLQELRSTESGSAVPFVFLTACAERADIRTGMDLGADDYLTKPFGADELLTTIKTRLGKYRQLASRNTELMRSDSLSMLSHEIRTPLNGIIGMSELLNEEPPVIDADEQRQILRDLRASSLRLGHTLSNLMLYLDLENAEHSDERRQAFTRGGPILAAAAVQSAVERKSRKWSRASQIAISHDVGLTRMPGPMLEKALEEIVDNAFRFSPSDTAIKVAAIVEGNWICITVEDRGSGMTREQIDSYQPFKQYNRARREQQGLGLGLAVARRLLELNHGRLQLAPGKDGGTVATIWLRRLTIQAQPEVGDLSALNNPSL